MSGLIARLSGSLLKKKSFIPFWRCTVGVIEKKYKAMFSPEDNEKYLNEYNCVLAKIKSSLKEVVDAAAIVLPKSEYVICGGLYHIGWYIADTFIPDYINGINDDDDCYFVFLVPEKYIDEPVLVCAFKGSDFEKHGPNRVFRELFEINLNPRKLSDPPPELNLEQMLKVKQGLKEFLLKMIV